MVGADSSEEVSPYCIGPGLCGFRECLMPKAQFPRRPLLGSLVNRDTPPPSSNNSNFLVLLFGLAWSARVGG
jgi:hypothetical protein